MAESAVRVLRETLPTRDGGPVLSRYVVMKGDRRIGYMPPSRTVYFSHRRWDRHYSFKMEGFGIDADVVEWMDSLPTLDRVVLVVDHEDGRRRAYITPTLLWLFHGRKVQLSRDYGEQVFVSWKEIEAADARLRKMENVWEPRAALEYYPPTEATSV